MIDYIDAKTKIDLNGIDVKMTVELNLYDAIASFYSQREKGNKVEKWVVKIKPSPLLFLGLPLEFELVG